MSRIELYKAVKYEANEFYADHGFTMVELWAVVNGNTPYDAKFWRDMCVSDYMERG